MRFLIPVFILSAAICSAVEIPFETVDGFILIHARAHGQDVCLALDSGASASVLSLDAAQRLHARLGANHKVDGVEADGVAYSIKGIDMTAGRVKLGRCGLAIDLHNAGQLCSQRIDGLIGAGFFNGRIVQIDYPRHCLRLLDSAPADARALPIRMANGVLCVPISVNGSHPRWIRIDTGCNDALHWVVPRSTPVRTRGVSIGFVTGAEDQTLVDIRIGGRDLPHTEATLHGAPIFPGEAGLLGNAILSRYVVTIDGVRGRLSLAGR